MTYETPELLKVQVCPRLGHRFQYIERGRRPDFQVEIDANPFGPEAVQSGREPGPFAVIRTGLCVEHFFQVQCPVRGAVRFARPV